MYKLPWDCGVRMRVWIEVYGGFDATESIKSLQVPI
jgi:hypothetical protein